MPGSRSIRGKKPPKDLEGESAFRDFWRENYSSRMDADLADVFDALFGGGGYHGGGVGGIDRQMSGGVMNEYGELSGGGFNQSSPFGNDWLGRDSQLYNQFKEAINLRRDVSPYMMYNNPEDPNMWDELPNPATPSRGEAGMPGEHMADPWLDDYSKQYWRDRAEDLTEIAREEMRRGGSRGLANILNQQRNRLDALRRRMARGR